MTAPVFDLTAAREFVRGLRARPQPGTAAPVDWADAPWPVKVYRAAPELRFADRSEHSDRGWVLRLLTEVVGVSRLVTAAGRTMARRPVASGGALYPTEVYAVLGGAAHHFDAARHELVALGPAPADDGVRLVLTHRFWKNLYKYGDFAYRLGAVDVGVVLGRLRTVATAWSGAVEVSFDFDDAAVHTLLGVDGEDEAAYAVVRVVPPVDRRAVPAVPACAPQVRERSAVVNRSAGVLAMQRAALAVAPAIPPPAALVGERIALPPVAPVQYRAEAAHRRRSSGPSFSGAAVAEETLAAVLAGCADPHLRVLCAVHRVTGRPPGWYGYDADRHALVPLRAEPEPARVLQSALYRPSMDVAAAGFTVHLAGGLEFTGARAWRIQQMRVGTAVDGATLTAAARGASAHPFLGFDASAVDGHYGLPAGTGTLAQVCVGVAAGAPVLTGRVW
ncbi:hypothetical protein E1258_15805 [Micromonospora sp. KC207]|uniref:hypothetical protein n=1 Tax=Micromonospora sp. KC207 TaxID=2530377 RepID=UPI00104D007D|nr:hypothetical protein [Micromonospora sp. KC207]TDC60106.1 hypothetical protein E1258_15805 [Micromonospora sp. KC207]